MACPACGHRFVVPGAVPQSPGPEPARVPVDADGRTSFDGLESAVPPAPSDVPPASEATLSFDWLKSAASPRPPEPPAASPSVPQFDWLTPPAPTMAPGAAPPELPGVATASVPSMSGTTEPAPDAPRKAPRKSRVIVLCKACVAKVDVSGLESGRVVLCPECQAEVVVPDVSGAKPTTPVAPKVYMPGDARDAFDRFYAEYDASARAPSREGEPATTPTLRFGHEDYAAADVPGDGAAQERGERVLPVAAQRPTSGAIPAERLVGQGLDRMRRGFKVLAVFLALGLVVGLSLTYRQGAPRHPSGEAAVTPAPIAPAIESPRVTLEAKERSMESVVAFGEIDPKTVDADTLSFLLTIDLGTQLRVVCTGKAAVAGFGSLIRKARKSDDPILVRVTGLAGRAPDGTYFLAALELAKHNGPMPLERLR